MNYKIQVTAENREAIKEIANRNGMNEKGFKFNSPNPIYHIKNVCFTSFKIPQKDTRNYQEITFEQFKDMFDKVDNIEKSLKKEYDLDIIDSDTDNIYLNGLVEGAKSESAKNYWYEKFKIENKGINQNYLGADKQETDPDKWLMETKSKNLSLDELKQNIYSSRTNGFDFTEIRKKLGLKQGESLAQALLNQWNEPKEEWQPKRGDRVLVWNDSENEEQEAIFFGKDKKSILVFDDKAEYNDYLKDITDASRFILNQFKHMKPLPIAPTEPEKTFKDKVIEVLEDEKEKALFKLNESVEQKNYLDAHAYSYEWRVYNNIVQKIKELN